MFKHIYVLLFFFISCSHETNKYADVENNQSFYYGRNQKLKFLTIENDCSTRDLAKWYNIPEEIVKKFNDNAEYLKAGSIVKIPVDKFHEITNSDTLESIAKLYDVALEDLANINNISIYDSIRNKNYLKIPKSDNNFDDGSKYNYIKFEESEMFSTEKKEENVSVKKRFFKYDRPLDSKNFIWPIMGKVLKDYSATGNQGIIISSPVGTIVKSASNGEVIHVEKNTKKYGNIVIMKHNKGYMTAYAYLGKIFVKKGQILNIDMQIGSVGVSNSLKEPHILFSMRKDNKNINPGQ